jgi:hypothetical protein
MPEVRQIFGLVAYIKNNGPRKKSIDKIFSLIYSILNLVSFYETIYCTQDEVKYDEIKSDTLITYPKQHLTIRSKNA